MKKDPTLTEKIITREGNGVLAWGACTNDDVVTISASMPGGRAHATNTDIPTMTAGLLMEGTARRDKHTIREFLTERAAELSFYAAMGRSGFTLRVRKEDARDTLALALEICAQASFPEKELAVRRAQQLSSLKTLRTDTGFRSEHAADTYWYGAEHLQYNTPIVKREENLAAITRDDLVAFQRKTFGRGDIRIAVAGAVTERFLQQTVRMCEDLPQTEVHAPLWKNAHIPRDCGGSLDTPIPDKTSVDVVTALPIPLCTTDPEYIPLALGMFVLGGNFTSRLCQAIRERAGLTYHTGAALAYVSPTVHGTFFTSTTFAPQTADKGTKMLMKEISAWARTGVTAKELSLAKQASIGGRAVGLGTTRGWANTLLGTMEAGRASSYLDEWESIVRDTSLSTVNAAIKKYVDPKMLFVSRAGTFEN